MVRLPVAVVSSGRGGASFTVGLTVTLAFLAMMAGRDLWGGVTASARSTGADGRPSTPRARESQRWCPDRLFSGLHKTPRALFHLPPGWLFLPHPAPFSSWHHAGRPALFAAPGCRNCTGAVPRPTSTPRTNIQAATKKTSRYRPQAIGRFGTRWPCPLSQIRSFARKVRPAAGGLHGIRSRNAQQCQSVANHLLHGRDQVEPARVNLRSSSRTTPDADCNRCERQRPGSSDNR
jgi:hypothetical protein